MCEVTEVFWVSGRILAVGWDKVVTEFIDDGKKVLDFITWKLCHTGEILCAAKNRSEAITTCSCTGELVLWNSWSGQPYLRFNIKYPKTKLKILYKKSGIILDDEINKNSSSDSGKLKYFKIKIN